MPGRLTHAGDAHALVGMGCAHLEGAHVLLGSAPFGALLGAVSREWASGALVSGNFLFFSVYTKYLRHITFSVPSMS